MITRLAACLALFVLTPHATPLHAGGKDPVTDSIDRGVDYLLPVTTEHLEELKTGNPREVPPTVDTGLFVFQML